MKKLTKKEREIEKFFGKLPPRNFLEIARTQNQIDTFTREQNYYLLIGAYWKNLHTGRTTPKSLLELPKYEQEYIQEATLWFNDIWVLVERTFPYIKQFFLKRRGFELPHKNDLEFFINLTILYAHQGMESFFLPFKEFPHRKMQKTLKLCSEARKRKLDPDEIKQIDAVLDGLTKNVCLMIAIEAWGQSKDASIKADVERIVERTGKLCDLIRRRTAKDRSFAIFDGETIYPSGPHGRNGYKLSNNQAYLS